jgi:hypothetical protein
VGADRQGCSAACSGGAVRVCLPDATAFNQLAHLIAGAEDPRVGDAPVVWLRPYHAPMVAVLGEHRAEHIAYLQGLAADPAALLDAPAPDWPDDTSNAPSTDGPVCGTCRGHCCVQGVAYHGFIDIRLLHRRQAAHGGTLADAATFYAASLPASHVQYSCLYHGEQGCVLPRADRAPICNGYACGALLEARALQQAALDAPLLLAGEVAGALVGAVVLTGQHIDALKQR